MSRAERGRMAAAARVAYASRIIDARRHARYRMQCRRRNPLDDEAMRAFQRKLDRGFTAAEVASAAAALRARIAGPQTEMHLRPVVAPCPVCDGKTR